MNVDGKKDSRRLKKSDEVLHDSAELLLRTVKGFVALIPPI